MEKQTWLEVSLTVNGELAEAVAEVLARFAPGGVVIESTAVKAEADEFGEPVGPLRVCGYLPVDDQLEDTRQRLIESLWYLGRIQPLPEARFSTIEQTNWMEAWKAHYQPIEIGENLLVLPAWVDVPETSRVWLKIDPGMAFGTGTHPTTQLSLMLLEKYLKPGDQLLDIGCGSGILAVAGRKLGASQAYGVDIDQGAVEIARETAVANHVTENISFEVGSVTEVAAGALPLQQAPVVVANILTHILVRLLDDGMVGLVEPGGVLLLSGILEEKEIEITAALERQDMKIIEKMMIDDWIGVAVRSA